MLFILKKFITPFLLPPGIFVVLLFLSGIWLCTKKTVRGGFFNMMLAILLWLLSTTPVASLLMQPLEQGAGIPRTLQGDVVVLLGGGAVDQAADLTGRGAPVGDTLQRIVTAVRVARKHHLPVLVSGGEVYAGRSAEAEVDKRFLVDLGVPAEMVIVEGKSRDTAENARRCREILDRRGFKRPLLVTSAYHMRRAFAAFEKEGVKVTPVPAQFMTSPGRAYFWADLLPGAGALGMSAAALKEHIGLLCFRLMQ